jgi:KDO2-lipid IV(A) lauroyltransferase
MYPMKNKEIADRFHYVILSALCRSINALPLLFIPFAGEMLGNLAYLGLRGKRRQIVYKNLRIVFGTNKNPKRLNYIFRASLQSLGKMIFETMAYRQFLGKMDHLISVEGEEYLKASLTKGKGVIAISIHLGSFIFINGKMARMGYTLHPIIRPPENEPLAKLMDVYIKDHGFKYIPDKPRHICVRKCREALKRNEIILLTTDLNVIDKDATFVEFFGYKVPTFRGPAVLAARTGASVHPMFMIREARLRHKLIIAPPLSLQSTGNLERDVKANTAFITKTTEPYILRYPEQWLWLHDRWRRMRKIEDN